MVIFHRRYKQYRLYYNYIYFGAMISTTIALHSTKCLIVRWLVLSFETPTCHLCMHTSLCVRMDHITQPSMCQRFNWTSTHRLLMELTISFDNLIVTKGIFNITCCQTYMYHVYLIFLLTWDFIKFNLCTN